MQRILVGTDASEHALRAVEMAIELAAETHAELYVLSVINPAEHVPPGVRGLYWDPDQYGDLPGPVALAVADHLAYCTRLAQGRGVPRVHERSRIGVDAARQLLECAQHNDIDLIVVGRRGRGRLAGLLLGSVSQKLVAVAPCSVLVAD